MRNKNVNPTNFFLKDPLEAIPMLPLNVETKRDENGLIQIRLQIPLKKWQKKIVDFLKYDYSKIIALDEMGTAFIERVDGHSSLREIAKQMAVCFKSDLAKMEEAVMHFTKTLMERSVLVLKVEPENRIG